MATCPLLAVIFVLHQFHSIFHQCVQPARPQPIRRRLAAPALLLFQELTLNNGCRIFPDIYGVVDHGFFVVEPKDAVIRLRMQTIKFCFLEYSLRIDMICLEIFSSKLSSSKHTLHDKAGPDDLQEGVAVLGRELHSEVQVLQRRPQVEEGIRCAGCHAEACALAPHLSRFADFIHCQLEGLVYFPEVGLGLSSLVLQLDVDGPKSAFGEVGLEALLDDLLSFAEPAHAHVHHHRLKLDFPLRIGLVSYLVHDLKGSLIQSDHFKVLGVLQKAHRYLL